MRWGDVDRKWSKEIMETKSGKKEIKKKKEINYSFFFFLCVCKNEGRTKIVKIINADFT